MSTKTSQLKPKTAKQQLAEGAKKLREAKAAEKKKPAPKTPPTDLEILPPIVECKDDIGEIMARCMILTHGGAAVKFKPETTIGEYISLFRNEVGNAERYQFRIGDFVIAGEKLPAFGGKYAIIMASMGLSINTLKSYTTAARNIPAALRNPALPFTMLREVAKVSAIEDKREIIEAAAASAKEGKPWTLKEIRAKADKCKPRKPKARKDLPTLREPTIEETGLILSLEDKASILCVEIAKAASLAEVDRKTLVGLNEKLDTIAEFAEAVS